MGKKKMLSLNLHDPSMDDTELAFRRVSFTLNTENYPGLAEPIPLAAKSPSKRKKSPTRRVVDR